MPFLNETQPICEDPPIMIGSVVRQYYVDGSYDRGRVCEITEGKACVDFLDWKRTWGMEQLTYTFIDGQFSLVPYGPGRLVACFSRQHFQD